MNAVLGSLIAMAILTLLLDVPTGAPSRNGLCRMTTFTQRRAASARRGPRRSEVGTAGSGMLHKS